MQDLTKVVFFRRGLRLICLVHNRWETGKQEREKEICQADQDWAREVRQAEQERQRERSSPCRPGMGGRTSLGRAGMEAKISTKSGYRVTEIGMQQAL